MNDKGRAEDILQADAEELYDQALELNAQAETYSQLREAAALFAQISGYKDAAELAERCLLFAEELKEDSYEEALELKEKARTYNEYQEAAELFAQISGYRDADDLSRKCFFEAKERAYALAVSYGKQKSSDSLEKAVDLLKSLEGWKDSALLIEKYESELALFHNVDQSTYQRAIKNLENGKRLEASKKFEEALDAYESAQSGFFVTMDKIEDSEVKYFWCVEKIKELNERNMSTLVFAVLDSKNPFGLADGTHYVYRVKAGHGSEQSSEKYTVDLVKGTTLLETKIKPGKYKIYLDVYGWNDLPGRQPAMHSISCPISLGREEIWQVTSNRPGLFSKLTISAQKIR